MKIITVWSIELKQYNNNNYYYMLVYNYINYIILY